MFALWSSLNYIPIKYKGPIKKTSSLRPIYHKKEEALDTHHLSFESPLIIPSPHMPVLATNERFLPIGGTFKAILASESHWYSPFTGGNTNRFGKGITFTLL